MKYFRPIQSGVNKGMTFFEYLRNNTMPYIFGTTATALVFVIVGRLQKEPILFNVSYVFLFFSLFAFIATVIDWGIKRKRWED